MSNSQPFDFRWAGASPPRITALKVQNYRVLRDVEFRDLTPLTVLIGPNGSGKSTVFDVFAFLSECFESGLRRALDKRGRLKELRSRNSHGPIVIEINTKRRLARLRSLTTLRLMSAMVRRLLPKSGCSGGAAHTASRSVSWTTVRVKGARLAASRPMNTIGASRFPSKALTYWQ